MSGVRCDPGARADMGSARGNIPAMIPASWGTGIRFLKPLRPACAGASPISDNDVNNVRRSAKRPRPARSKTCIFTLLDIRFETVRYRRVAAMGVRHFLTVFA